MGFNWNICNTHELKAIEKLLEEEENKYKDELQILPPFNLRYAAFKLCPYDKLKVVILGQDPYHNVGEAMGLCFSVQSHVTTPPSLRNIFKELKNDTGIHRTNSDLTDWAMQGILLLNTALTVREHCPNSHYKYWVNFTNEVIQFISNNKSSDKIIFILWGNNAIKKKHLIDESRHHVLTASHPSPLSANRGGFFGCKHFSKVNELLKQQNKDPIIW